MMKNDQVNDSGSYGSETAIAHITEMLGTGFRDALTAAFGGTEIKVPSKKATLTDDHWLVAGIGQIDAEELVEIMAGEQFYVPVGLRAGVNPRRVKTEELVKAGKTNNEIARELGISTRMVRNYRRDLGLESRKLCQVLSVPIHGLCAAIRAGALQRTAPQ